VKRYGRFAAEAKEQFAWINALGRPRGRTGSSPCRPGFGSRV